MTTLPFYQNNEICTQLDRLNTNNIVILINIGNNLAIIMETMYRLIYALSRLCDIIDLY